MAEQGRTTITEHLPTVNAALRRAYSANPACPPAKVYAALERTAWGISRSGPPFAERYPRGVTEADAVNEFNSVLRNSRLRPIENAGDAR